MEEHISVVPVKEAGTRVDVFVASVCGISRTLAQKLLDEGLVRVAGAVVAKRQLLVAG